MRVSVFIATSLDGYIAGPDGDIDWLNNASAEVPEDDDLGYAAHMESVDIMVMGRKSYEKVLSFGDWPYGELPMLVLSRNEITFPEQIPNCVTHSSESPREIVERLESQGIKHIYVDGGVTIQRFLAGGLISDITITLIPVLLGAGIPLFAELAKPIDLKLKASRSSENGFIQISYTMIY